MNLLKSQTGQVALAVIAGATVGAALGVLYAPDKGSATRKKISDTSHEYASNVTNKLNGLVQSITPQFHAVKDNAVEMVETVKTKVKNA